MRPDDEPGKNPPPPLPPFPPADPKNPFETLILLWIGLASASFTTGDPGSAVLQENLPRNAVIMWGSAALIGSVMALIGLILQKHTLDGLILERTGLILVGGAAAIYAYVIFQTTSDFAGVRYIVGVQIGLALACVWRSWHITKRLRWARSAARKE